MREGQIFAGKVVAVTGASRGLGLAIARAFHAEGAAVALMDLDIDRARRASELLGPGAAAAAYAVDVTQEREVQEAFHQVMAEFGHVDVLVNNAGIATRDTFQELSLDTWRRTIDVNLTGAWLCMRAVVPSMITRGRGGRIISVGSLAGRNGGTTVSAAYAASKAGLAGLTRAVARQVGDQGVLCNCVAPGALETDMTVSWPESVMKSIRAGVPLGKLGSVDDVTGVVVFLASPAARYINGVTLDVNGGAYIAP